jgi:hypothetical protein
MWAFTWHEPVCSCLCLYKYSLFVSVFVSLFDHARLEEKCRKVLWRSRPTLDRHRLQGACSVSGEGTWEARLCILRSSLVLMTMWTRWKQRGVWL